MMVVVLLVAVEVVVMMVLVMVVAGVGRDGHRRRKSRTCGGSRRCSCSKQWQPNIVKNVKATRWNSNDVGGL